MAVSKRVGLGAAVAALILTLPGAASATERSTWNRAELIKFAMLPAATFVPGSEPSGSLLGTAPINGITPPFADQPVQGFSGVLRNTDGTFDVLSDNGFGNKANSADFLLRIQRVAPGLRRRRRRRGRRHQPDRPVRQGAVRAHPRRPRAHRCRLRRRVDHSDGRRHVLDR